MKCRLLFVVVIFLTASCGADKETNADGVWVKAVGQSGKIKVGTQENVDSDPKRVIVDFDQLTEYTNDKETAASNKHKINTFANTDFTFTDVVDGNYQNLTTKSFTFKATNILAQSSGSPSMEVEVMIFTEVGTVDNGGEKTNVQKGTMKFNVVIDNWEFCTAQSATAEGCQNRVGNYLELIIKLQTKSKPTKKTSDSSSDGDSYGVGEDVTVIMSKKIKVDGVYSDMESGYPQLEENGNNSKFKFLFPKGANIIYDPTIAQGGSVTVQSAGLAILLTIAAAVMHFSKM